MLHPHSECKPSQAYTYITVLYSKITLKQHTIGLEVCSVLFHNYLGSPDTSTLWAAQLRVAPPPSSWVIMYMLHNSDKNIEPYPPKLCYNSDDLRIYTNSKKSRFRRWQNLAKISKK